MNLSVIVNREKKNFWSTLIGWPDQTKIVLPSLIVSYALIQEEFSCCMNQRLGCEMTVTFHKQATKFTATYQCCGNTLGK